MTKDILNELVEKNVEIWSLRGEAHVKDAGILEAYDEHWIKLRQGHGTVLYFSIANIRLIKPL